MTRPPFLDPDRRIASVATLQHFALLGAGVMGALSLFFPPKPALALTVAFGVAWELAQWDTCRSLRACHVNDDLARGFRPGYGFSLLDLAADVAGALVVYLAVIRMGA